MCGVNENIVMCILTDKLSQDHLEIWFSAIRAMSGFCNNPTKAQFITAYNKLLLKLSLVKHRQLVATFQNIYFEQYSPYWRDYHHPPVSRATKTDGGHER